VHSGQACLDWLTATTCDLLLLDYHLPDMEGLDVLRTLVRTQVAIPVVLVTGLGDEELVVKALHLGAANYVPKVGNYLATLPKLLHSVLKEHQVKLSQGILVREPRRILYVEHHEMDIDLTLHHFAEMAPQLELEVVRTCDEALARLNKVPAYDAALIDLRMPDQSGLDFVREAKRRGLQLPPFILISGKGDEGAAIASLTLGAADYVAKREGYLDQLPHTIDRAIVYDRLNRVNAQLQAELTERRRTQEELRFRNAILSTQQENSLDGILVVDVDGKVVSSNQRFTEMWGVTPVIVNSQFADSIKPLVMRYLVNPESYLQHMDRINKSPHEKSQNEIALKGGRTFDSYSAPMRALDGTHFGRVWYFRDITARKNAETEREKLEEQLRASQKMEAIGSLAGGIAHDFNNLLSGILSYTEFAIGQLPENHAIQSDLQEVKKEGERAVALTRQLLAFSRKQVLQPVPLNLNHIALGVEKMLRRILGEDIEFQQSLAPDLGLTLADPGQIEQVLMNLVVNARDAMASGGKLTIETSNVQVEGLDVADYEAVSPGPYVELVVTDNGSGMDEQTRLRIFEPFFTTKEKDKGTGLGLSTVYGIVKQSGGNIWVYSEPGKGTCFKIHLPRELSATEATTIEFPVSPTPATGTETILVVEDEEALRRVAIRALRSVGYTVLTAENGLEALKASKEYNADIHLLLTDVVMPRMSGRILAQTLTLKRPMLKVIYMSGYTDNAIINHGVLKTGSHFLSKPFTCTDLTRKVRQVLDLELVNRA
jgi:PAS domain S-box-containing protein